MLIQSQSLDSSGLSLTCIPKLSSWKLLQWLFGRLRRYRIEGDSMMPTLKSGDEVLVKPHRYVCFYQEGDCVCFYRPDKPELMCVKRIQQVFDQSWFEMMGDNKACSTDSRHYGRVPVSYMLGRVVCSFP